MSLNDRLTEDMKQFMRSGDKFSLSVVRMLRAAIKNVEIDTRRPVEDEGVLDILNREVKQRRDALQEFEKAGRDDLADQARAEIALIQQYLPQQLSDEELQQIVRATVAEVGAVSRSDMGKVMSALMPKVKGRSDGKKVNEAVRQLLV